MARFKFKVDDTMEVSEAYDALLEEFPELASMTPAQVIGEYATLRAAAVKLRQEAVNRGIGTLGAAYVRTALSKCLRMPVE